MPNLSAPRFLYLPGMGPTLVSYLPFFVSGRIVNIRSSIAKLFVVGSCLLVLAGSPVQAREAPPPLRVPAQLHLASGSVMLLDLNSDKILYSRNSNLVAPIASVTKLMTAMVVLDAKQSMDEII